MYDDDLGAEDGLSLSLAPPDNEKKVRREIANSNERRRMQSINAGFQSLRTLLPHHEGEKLSKAAILQQTAEYIYSLEQEKTRLLSQNCQLKRLLGLSRQRLEGMTSLDTSSIKRKRISIEDMTDFESSLDSDLLQERQLRQRLEKKLRVLEIELNHRSEDKVEEILIAHPHEMSTIIVEDPMSIDDGYKEDDENEIRNNMIVLSSPSPPSIPSSESSRPLIKHESVLPAVSVEPIESHLIQPSIKSDAGQLITTESGHRSYVVTMNNSTTRQNLDSIVEAIRHLEGDHLFSSEEIGNGPHQVVKEEVVEYALTPETSDKSSFQRASSGVGNIIILKQSSVSDLIQR